MHAVAPDEVPRVLSRHACAPAVDLVLDVAASRGCWLVDARDGRRVLDLFSFYSSLPLGMNPPDLADDPTFVEHLGRVALHKPSNCDIATVEYATFVATFARVLGVPELPHLFFIEGGALAVENALKVAFDWKARRDARGGPPGEANYRVLHLRGAFHGRSGYTLSLTNTDPVKTALFTRHDWPRLPTPVTRFPVEDHLPEIEAAESEAIAVARRELSGARDIACFVAEPVQCEGGDNHLRPQFLRAVEELCHEFGVLFVLDEVQTGGGVTGTPWLHQQFGLKPDLVAFGKRTQVCGVMGGRRVDLVPDNAFAVPGRLSSTWAGDLTDMVRATRVLEVVERDGLIGRAAGRGERLLRSLHALRAEHPDLVSNVRGRGLLCAIDLPNSELRDDVVTQLFELHDVLVVGCGERGIRFRPAMTVSDAELDLGVESVAAVLNALPARSSAHAG